ncbi:hypothetical protein QBC42DRAFT_293007 [Cladorrhinum samala]|uniref:RRM domain-containing protein n=1 Tax=Cladorrhinum samala TaxID=585594 RepID=A0AAV9I5V3_9PEZI|nr:hypothetical protein QBC42DRAFT_293007 [Cladorrhinum samala]
MNQGVANHDWDLLPWKIVPVAVVSSDYSERLQASKAYQGVWKVPRQVLWATTTELRSLPRGLASPSVPDSDQVPTVAPPPARVAPFWTLLRAYAPARDFLSSVVPPQADNPPVAPQAPQADHPFVTSSLAPFPSVNLPSLAVPTPPMPDPGNCSFWITNLPPELTYRQLLEPVRNVGRVYATIVNPPDRSKGHKTAAATIAFFELSAAFEFWERCHSGPGLRYGRFRARVSGNRQGAPDRSGSKWAHCSRILKFTGPPALVEIGALDRLIRAATTIKYDVECHRTIGANSTGGTAETTLQLGSWRSQAESIFNAFWYGQLSQSGISVSYAPDPCAPPGLDGEI